MEDPFTLSRVILIEPGDSKQCWKKVTEVLEYVDRDLGLTDTKLSDYEQKRVIIDVSLCNKYNLILTRVIFRCTCI